MLWSSSLGRNGISERRRSSEQQAGASCRRLINIPHQWGSSRCTAVRDAAPRAAAEPERVLEHHSPGAGRGQLLSVRVQTEEKQGLGEPDWSETMVVAACIQGDLQAFPQFRLSSKF